MINNKINIIGLSGSPRNVSNSSTLLNSLLEGASSAGANCQLIRAANLEVRSCTHCDYCREFGKCLFYDDMNQLYQSFIHADAIVIASPVYFMGLCSQIKLIADRLQMFWAFRDTTGKSLITEKRQSKLPRKGVFIATAARNTGSVFTGVKESMRWVFDALDCEFWDSMFVGNCENGTDILSRPELLNDARELGKRLTESYN